MPTARAGPGPTSHLSPRLGSPRVAAVDPSPGPYGSTMSMRAILAAAERIHVLDVPVGQKSACDVTNDLVDVDHDAAFLVDAEPLGLDVRRDDRELAQPVGPDGALPTLAPLVHGVRPVDVGSHEGQRRLDVTAVEGLVGPAKKRLAVVHLWYATKRATAGWRDTGHSAPPGSLFGCRLSAVRPW